MQAEPPRVVEEVDLFAPGAQEHWYRAYGLLHAEAPVQRLPGEGLTFYAHQMSDHHERHDFADVLAGIRLDYIDPVEGAGGGLPHTADPALPHAASEAMRTAQERFPLTIPAWWSARA